MSILLFLVLGIIAFFLINYLGGRHIQQSYQNDLFDGEFGDQLSFCQELFSEPHGQR